MTEKKTEKKLLEEIKEINNKLAKLVNQNDKVFDFESAWKYLKVSDSYLYKITQKRKIKFSKPTKGKIYFKQSWLDEFLFKNPILTDDEIESKVNDHVNSK